MNPEGPNTPASDAPPEETPTAAGGGGDLRFGGISPETYWKRNIACVLSLLVVWFLVSYGCGILWADELDKMRTPGGGVKLGFWFAQQGSIYVFVVLIAIYVWYMNKLDAKFFGKKR